jgi:hypothetical protein
LFLFFLLEIIQNIFWNSFCPSSSFSSEGHQVSPFENGRKKEKRRRLTRINFRRRRINKITEETETQ